MKGKGNSLNNNNVEFEKHVEEEPSKLEQSKQNNNNNNKPSALLQIFTLFLLTFQTAIFFLLTRYSRAILKEKYISSTLIVSSECIKFFASFFLIFNDQKKKGKTTKEFFNHIVFVFKNSLPLAPAAFGYFCQNLLAYVSLKNIRAAYYSVLNQLKILSTAFFSVTLLGRRLNTQKWVSLSIMVVGVILVKYEGKTGKKDDVSSNFFGLFTSLIVPTLSGINGVYMEKFVKKQQQGMSLWDRNLQLSFYSIFFALLSAFIFDGKTILEKGYFYGYSINAILLPLNLGCGGLIVALVIKYSNAIIKGFATTLAIIISTIFSTIFWGFEIRNTFIVGLVLVIGSIFLYIDVIKFNFGKGKEKKN